MNSPLQQVPWLDRSHIAFEADQLRKNYESFTGKPIPVPVPVEAIIEKYLGLHLSFDDLEEILGEPDVLGATWVEEKRMIIHSRLLEGTEGRQAFTSGHEVGHWVLHKDLLPSYFRFANPRVDGEPTIVCGKKESKTRAEWQADYFASCLLMPDEEVTEAFISCFGNQPLVMHNQKSFLGPIAKRNHPAIDPALDTAKEIAREVIEAGGFSNCSKEAMRYRLEDLGLLINRVGKS
jgi:Zn-dependent peptidase ImmA (M78 family)